VGGSSRQRSSSPSRSSARVARASGRADNSFAASSTSTSGSGFRSKRGAASEAARPSGTTSATDAAARAIGSRAPRTPGLTLDELISRTGCSPEVVAFVLRDELSRLPRRVSLGEDGRYRLTDRVGPELLQALLRLGG
jgi:hypothetical protein